MRPKRKVAQFTTIQKKFTTKEHAQRLSDCNFRFYLRFFKALLHLSLTEDLAKLIVRYFPATVHVLISKAANMRLLHTSMLKLKEFVGWEVPNYAILSHRWEDEEITFQDLQTYSFGECKDAILKKGWSKIRGCCEQGTKDGFDWVWIDSCCIDKTSSAELTEAINSMFDWYRNANVCYAYLSDVPSTEHMHDHGKAGSAFRQSKWFTRGWTLQEFLAPGMLEFYDSQWEYTGSKAGMEELLKEITGIRDLDNFDQACVAQKISWASRRETTRVEDRAYSLMGLLGVNMPPLYGEGNKAFLRLQLELIKISDDESIFAWLDELTVSRLGRGLLATSPEAFESSGDVYQLGFENDRPAYSMTNKGLLMEAQFVSSSATGLPIQNPHNNDILLLPLQCMLRTESSQGKGRIAVGLRHVEGDQYTRITSDQFILMDREHQKKFENDCQSQEGVRFHVKQRDQWDSCIGWCR